MTRKSKRELERSIEELSIDSADEDYILVIGGDPEKAACMTFEEYEELHGHPPDVGDGILVEIGS